MLIGGLGSKWREDVKTGAGTGKLNTLNYHKIWQRKQNSEWILGGTVQETSVLKVYNLNIYT